MRLQSRRRKVTVGKGDTADEEKEARRDTGAVTVRFRRGLKYNSAHIHGWIILRVATYVYTRAHENLLRHGYVFPYLTSARQEQLHF